jgi:hypothetical protein
MWWHESLAWAHRPRWSYGPPGLEAGLLSPVPWFRWAPNRPPTDTKARSGRQEARSINGQHTETTEDGLQHPGPRGVAVEAGGGREGIRVDPATRQISIRFAAVGHLRGDLSHGSQPARHNRSLRQVTAGRVKKLLLQTAQNCFRSHTGNIATEEGADEPGAPYFRRCAETTRSTGS